MALKVVLYLLGLGLVASGCDHSSGSDSTPDHPQLLQLTEAQSALLRPNLLRGVKTVECSRGTAGAYNVVERRAQLGDGTTLISTDLLYDDGRVLSVGLRRLGNGGEDLGFVRDVLARRSLTGAHADALDEMVAAFRELPCE